MLGLMSRDRTPPPLDVESADRISLAPKGRQTITIPRIEIFIEREAGKPAERSVVLNGDHLLIGAHRKCDLQLTDPLVSRFHCRLVRVGESYRVIDAGSRNGTVVDGVRIRDADLPTPECHLVVGASVLRVRELDPTYAAEVPASPWFGAMCGKSLAMRKLFDRIERAGKSESDVLIEGERGSGKELIAMELTRCSKRAQRPFLIIDCTSISPWAMESALFGDAAEDHVGALEQADKGILVLDEIGEVPLEAQPKLLRALADREIQRVGDAQPRKIDVRVFATTSRSLEREVNQKRFRGDLFFRLSAVTLRAPPLRERLEDIPLLVHSFLAALGIEDQKATLFTPEVLDLMKRHDWPGNVRELRGYVERRVGFPPPATE